VKALIGIGCSWTQGEGGYPDELWKAHDGRMWLKLEESRHLIPLEQENSWVNRLAKKINCVPVNLGQRAIGNRGAVRSLYLQDNSEYGGGTVILMLTGFDRFDFFNKNWGTDHYKFLTMWPQRDDKDEHRLYAKAIHNEPGVAAETACCILEAQNYAKANNFDFIFANAFETRGKEYFDSMCPSISEQIDWDRYVHSHTDYICFAQLLVRRDGLCKETYEAIAEYYPNMSYPAKYMTNDIHPTQDGYELIADEIKRIFYV
jgi:hypothetical protein